MKRVKVLWNIIDMLLKTLITIILIVAIYLLCENLEKYIYRYTIFPLMAFLLIFILGLILGKDLERTRHNKPIGAISKRITKIRKAKNRFFFEDNGQTYSPHKEIIEEIKSGEIVHVKQFKDSDFEESEFHDIYDKNIDDIIDKEIENINKENKE